MDLFSAFVAEWWRECGWGKGGGSRRTVDAEQNTRVALRCLCFDRSLARATGREDGADTCCPPGPTSPYLVLSPNADVFG